MILIFKFMVVRGNTCKKQYLPVAQLGIVVVVQYYTAYIIVIK